MRKWIPLLLCAGVVLLVGQGIAMLLRRPVLGVAALLVAGWFGYRLYRLA